MIGTLILIAVALIVVGAIVYSYFIRPPKIQPSIQQVPWSETEKLVESVMLTQDMFEPSSIKKVVKKPRKPRAPRKKKKE